MYSGTTFRNKSGRIMGVHQKIDKVARRHLTTLVPQDVFFPGIKQILHFEGKNGPDGIKRKSPAVDEPWHFIDPNDPNDTALLGMVDEHLDNLTLAILRRDTQRAAFEAAWMAHAVTDGLTPAHHYPLEQVLKELRGGEGLETRTSLIKKNLMSGGSTVATAKNTWKFWGAKGAMTMHIAFETGVASVVPYQRFSSAVPSDDDIRLVTDNDYRYALYVFVQQVAAMKIFERFIRDGWTNDLARQVNRQLMPIIIKAVILGWLEAIRRAEDMKKR